jgi:WD40 repeat protein
MAAGFRVAFDPKTGQQLATLEVPRGRQPNWLGFSPDGRYLAAGLTTNGVPVWDLATLRHALREMNPDW